MRGPHAQQAFPHSGIGLFGLRERVAMVAVVAAVVAALVELEVEVVTTTGPAGRLGRHAPSPTVLTPRTQGRGRHAMQRRSQRHGGTRQAQQRQLLLLLLMPRAGGSSRTATAGTRGCPRASASAGAGASLRWRSDGNHERA